MSKTIINIDQHIGDLSDLNLGIGFTHKELISLIGKDVNQEGYEIFINSIGGDVDEGEKIIEVINSLNVPIKTVVDKDAVCASMAVDIFLTGSERIVTEGCEFMIHAPWTETSGNSNDLLNSSKELKEIENRRNKEYSKVTGLSIDLINILMQDDTYFSVEDLLNLGFATDIYRPLTVLPEDNIKVNKEIKAVAFSSKIFKHNKMNKLTKEDKSWFEGVINPLKKALGQVKSKAIVLTSANGDEIEFPNVMEGSMPQIGDEALIDGNKVEDGTFEMPSIMAEVTFKDGMVAEIEEIESEDELAAALNEIEELKKENESLKTTNATLLKENKQSIKAVEETKEAISKIESKFAFKVDEDTKQVETKVKTKRRLFKN